MSPYLWALLLGLGHAVLDACSGFLIHRDLPSAPPLALSVVQLTMLSNAIAFGGQAPLGLAADRLRCHGRAALLGLGCAAAALLLGPRHLLAGLILVGLGNGLYHMGAGAMVLQGSGNQAGPAGLFVGPGALGLFAGVRGGGGPTPMRYPLIGLLACCAPLLAQARRALESHGATSPRPWAGRRGLALLCAAGLLGSVWVRAIVGGAVAGAWRDAPGKVPLLLATAACLGKAAGGVIGDRFGWMLTSVGALMAAGPLLTLFRDFAPGAVGGALLFQFTMPITLKATHLLLPRHPGFAFGLPSLVLLAGAAALDRWSAWLTSVPVSAALIGLAALAVATGLWALERLMSYNHGETTPAEGNG